MPAFPIVDIHTHVYPISYMELLRSRTTVPYIHESPQGDSRLIILSSDDSPAVPKAKRGRPVDSSYCSLDAKLAFMRKHGITTSIISVANPWLDFLPPEQAAYWAEKINNELEAMCSSIPRETGKPLNECYSVFAFGVLPLSSQSADVSVKEIARLKKLTHLKGVIMGTTGLGNGLDDPALDTIWAALQNTDTLTFLHPHYGLPRDAFGGEAVTERYGHVLPLALGFPLETTIAVTRMFLAGVFDRFPTLKILLAHSGGALPFLAARIESCVAHERKFIANGGDIVGPAKSVWDVLSQNIYLDAVIYGDVGLKAAVHGAGSFGRVLFGTDHPFFPPLGGKDEEWLSVSLNRDAINAAFGAETDATKAILGGNAIRILHLEHLSAP